MLTFDNQRNGTGASNGGDVKTTWERAVYAVKEVGIGAVCVLGMLYLLNRMMDQFPRLEGALTRTSTVMEQMSTELREHRRHSEHESEWRGRTRPDEAGSREQ